METLLDRINPALAPIDEAWAAEVERRIDTFEEDKISAVDGESAMRSLRERI